MSETIPVPTAAMAVAYAVPATAKAPTPRTSGPAGPSAAENDANDWPAFSMRPDSSPIFPPIASAACLEPSSDFLNFSVSLDAESIAALTFFAARS